jgi:hypothetical protein
MKTMSNSSAIKKNASVFPVSDLITIPQKGNKEEKKNRKVPRRKKNLKYTMKKK